MTHRLTRTDHRPGMIPANVTPQEVKPQKPQTSSSTMDRSEAHSMNVSEIPVGRIPSPSVEEDPQNGRFTPSVAVQTHTPRPHKEK